MSATIVSIIEHEARWQLAQRVKDLVGVKLVLRSEDAAVVLVAQTSEKAAYCTIPPQTMLGGWTREYLAEGIVAPAVEQLVTELEKRE